MDEGCPARRSRTGSSGNLLPSTENEFASPANTFTLGALVLVALAAVIVTMSALADGVKSVLDLLFPQQGLSSGLFSVTEAIASFSWRPNLPSFFSTLAAEFNRNWWPAVRVVAVGLFAVVFFSIPVIFVWLRWLERRDFAPRCAGD